MSAGNETMRLAHLSDLHILDFTGVRVRQFLNKRVTGLANLMSFRRQMFSADVLERMIEDLLDVGYDHVVVTGDIGNLALASEFERVLAYLSHLGGYRRLSLVPGDHDYYVNEAVQARLFERTFHRYLFTDFSDLDVALYPYVKLLAGDEVSIIGLSSAVKTPPFIAAGEVDTAQMGRLREVFRRRRIQRSFKVALIHHPLHERGPIDEWTGSLRNRDDVARLLVDLEVDLVLHGHDHRPHRALLDPDGRRIPVICNGSSTSLDPHPDKIARYNLYTIEGGRLTLVETRIYDPTTRRFRWKQTDSAVELLA